MLIDKERERVHSYIHCRRAIFDNIIEFGKAIRKAKVGSGIEKENLKGSGFFFKIKIKQDPLKYFILGIKIVPKLIISKLRGSFCYINYSFPILLRYLKYEKQKWMVMWNLYGKNIFIKNIRLNLS